MSIIISSQVYSLEPVIGPNCGFA